MKKIMYMAVAAIAVLSSCSSEEFTQSSNGINGEAKVFTGTIESGATTRTSYNSTAKKAEWIANTDKVNIGGAEYTAKTTGATTTFTGTGATQESGKYKAYYPSSMYNSGTITLPATYTYDGNFNMPMYAESTTTDLSFQNICGVLAITVTNAQVPRVTTITVESNEPISGPCTIESSGEGSSIKYSAKATGTDDASKKITINCVSGSETSLTLDATGKTFYVPVPAGDHKLKITVLDENTTSYMEMSSAQTIARNTIYNITFLSKHMYETASPDRPVVYIGGTKWATMNLGATEVAESAAKSYGDYYAWGEIATYYTKITYSAYDNVTVNTWNTESDNKATHIPGAKTGYYPNQYYGNSATEWDPVPYDAAGNMKSGYDVATHVLGVNWCMPTKNEFMNLSQACGITETEGASPTGKISSSQNISAKGAYWIDYSGTAITIDGTTYKVPGMLFVADATDTSKRVFFPAADAFFNYNKLSSPGANGCYWSSSMDTDNPQNGYMFYFWNTEINSLWNYSFRSHGCSIRPVLK